MGANIYNISSQGIRERSNSYLWHEMKAYVEEKLGFSISDTEFTAIMFKKLPKESYYQGKIIKWLTTTFPDAFVWKLAAGPYGRKGLPDVWAIIDGMVFCFEVKRPYVGVTTPLQKQTINKINSAGGHATVVCWPVECKKFIQDEKNKCARSDLSDFTEKFNSFQESRNTGD